MAEHECLNEKRIDNLERKVEKLSEGDIDQKVLMTEFRLSLQQVTKSNEIMQEYMKESQTTFQKINENLDRLNSKTESQDNKLEEVAQKVDKLSDDFDKAESKNLVIVDQRLLIKKILSKYILPIGGLAAIIAEVLNLLGVFNK